jgi:ribonuclease PH
MPWDAAPLERDPITDQLAAISCGLVDGAALCDLDYSEDSRAEVDANIVMAGADGLVEVQATAEQTPVTKARLDELLALAEPAMAALREAQTAACK